MKKLMLLFIGCLIVHSSVNAMDIFQAAKDGDAGRVKELLLSGFDPNQTNGVKPLLHLAAGCGHLDVANVLIAHGAEVNRPDMIGMTPLHYTTNPEVAKVLIEYGAEVDIQDHFGATPLRYADPDVAEVLIAHNADVNQQDNIGWTPLHFAASRGYQLRVSTLTAHGADVSRTDICGSTPLHYAVLRWHLPVIHLLMEAGADANKRNDAGSTPLEMIMKISNQNAYRAMTEDVAEARKKGYLEY